MFTIDAFWIILAGALVAASGSILGSFLMLRKMSLIGDAISHAVLPGIVLSYLWSQSRDPFVMLFGATISGILTTLFIETLNKKAGVQEDASIGVTFTFLFALGVILISVYGHYADLDQDCVLFGEINFIPLNRFEWLGMDMGPQAIYILGLVLVVIVLVIYLGYKQFMLTSFDPSYAMAIGMKTLVWHYLLMGLVSLTTVASFEAVGAILVIALLIVPPATAYLISNRLPEMLAWGVFFGLLAAIGGYVLAYSLDVSVSASMVSVSGLLFAVVFLAGILRKYLNQKKNFNLEPEKV
jgi:manganese/zinc/iron transport system permease protein